METMVVSSGSVPPALTRLPSLSMARPMWPVSGAVIF
jgi:hypothetical protein